MTQNIFATLGVVAVFLTATNAAAEGLRPQADFTFRRIGVPAPGSGPRITVQIDPVEQARVLAPPPPDTSAPSDTPSPDGAVPGAVGPGAGAYDWYWQIIPPARGAAPVSVEAALAALSAGAVGQGVPAPRLQALQQIATRHGADILAATIGTRVSPALVLAVIGVESAGRIDALSPKGAAGLMQLIPATAERFGVTDASDAGQNIRGGVAYLDWLMAEFGGDALMVLAGYNAGEGAVRSHGGVPPYPETRAYVPKVLAAWTVARGLCLTPPELVSDGCVFRVAAR